MTPTPSPEVALFRSSVYRIFSEWFLHPPSKECVSFFEDRGWIESACSLLGPEIRELAPTFAQQLDGDQLAAEFAALFIAPGPQQTFPFETNYREKYFVDGQSRPGRTLGRSAVEVQGTYLEWGMPPSLGTDELPDHAGTELRFMSLLVEAERLSWEGQDDSCARLILQAQAKFLNSHILPWFPQWLECVSYRARLPFYKSVATLLKRFLETEKITLDQLCAAAPRACQSVSNRVVT